MSFFAYDPGFTGGVSVAVGDVNGDGHADIITGAGAGGGPHVKVFSGANGAVLQSFFAYDPNFRGGVNVAAGDVNGDGKADIVTGQASGTGSVVNVFDGASGSLLQSVAAFGNSFGSGVRVAAADLNGDDHADVIVTGGAGTHTNVVGLDGPSLNRIGGFSPFDPSYIGGAFVG
jgi:hypothetical protein